MLVNLLSLNHLMLIQGVEWQLKQLRDDGLLRHVGATKNGHWEIIKEESNGKKNNKRSYNP